MTLKSVVFYISEFCNFRCGYCFFVQSGKTPRPFIETEKWVEAWNRLKPEILDITGGEPFLQPRFVDLINALDPVIKVAITTSLQCDMTRFVQEVPPSRIFSMTLSYHPSQTYWEKWMGKLLLVKERGFKPLTVNFVSWPEQLWLVEGVKNAVEQLGVRFHLDPYVPSKIFFNMTEKEKEYIMKFTKEDRLKSIDESIIPHLPCFCDAGKTHLQVECDGTAKRCGRLGTIVGNILDPKFKLWGDKEVSENICHFAYSCTSCDYDKIRKTIKFLDDGKQGI